MMWTVHKVYTGPTSMKADKPTEIEVPRDEVWILVGLEQSCGGAPCKLVFLTRKRDQEDPKHPEIGGRLEFWKE